MPVEPRFLSTELGLKLLRSSLRPFLAGSMLATPFRGRVRETSQGSAVPRELALQSGFLRLVSITEATVDLLAAELTEKSLSDVDEVLRLLMLEKELAASSSWESRRRAFKRHHGVDLRKCNEHKKVEGAVEVRNAIAHGLGRLTTRQAISQETTKRLKAIDVSETHGYVQLNAEDLKQCASYSADFLRSVDAEVLAP